MKQSLNLPAIMPPPFQLIIRCYTMLDAKLLKKYKFVELNIFPDHVVCAFPYILAITQEAVEFRYAVNGSLLQTLCMPELKLITSKVSNFLRWDTFSAHIPWSIFMLPPCQFSLYSSNKIVTLRKKLTG